MAASRGGNPGEGLGAARLSLLRALTKEVQSGTRTPQEAEERALAAGHDFHNDPLLGAFERHDMTTNSTWWLPLAVLFYAWRNLPLTRLQWDRFERWGGDLWRDPHDERQVIALSEAENLLKSDLAVGIVRSFGTTPDGQSVAIPTNEWTGLTFERSRRLWGAADDRSSRYSAVFVLRHEVVPLWTDEFASRRGGEQSDARERSSPDTGGRPPRIADWHAMWIEVCRIVHEEGVPAERVALRKRMQQWFVDHGLEPPADSTMTPLFKNLFRALS